MEKFPKALFTLALLVIVTWGIAAAQPFLVPLSIAALLAFLITPLVSRLRRWRLPEWAAISLSSLVLLTPIAAVTYLLVLQGQNLVEDFPSIVKSAQGEAERFSVSPLGQRLGLNNGIDLSSIFGKISAGAGKGIAIVVGGLAALMNATSQLVIILLYAFLMVAARGHLRVSSERIIARSDTIQASVLLDEVSALVQRFLIAKALIVVIISVASILALKIFGVKYSLLLGIWNGITFALVPAVGFLFGAVPTVIVALATGHSILATIGIFGVLFLLNVVEGNILTPKLVGGRLNVNTLASFIGLFAGGLLWGIWGMFLAIPIMGVMRICFSAIPSLQPWGDLMAEREDKKLRLSLVRKSS